MSEVKNVNIVVSIDGSATVETPNDLATFNVMIKSKNDSLEDAQRQVEEKTKLFLKSIDDKISLDGEISVSLSNYKLEHREGSERYSAGYQAVNSVKWTCFVNDKLNDLYKMCCKADTNMSYPIFFVKNRDTVVDQTIEKAADNAKSKLANECRLLGVSSAALKIHNWSFGYNGILPSNHTNQIQNVYNGYPLGVTGPVGPMGSNYMNSVMPTVTKLGTVYQELLDTKIVPGTTFTTVVVRINYVWAE